VNHASQLTATDFCNKISAFVDALDLGKLGFDGVVPEVTGRPSYHPSKRSS